MMPAGWTTKRFADVADYRAGRTPARANPLYWKDADDGVPWVAISDMTEFGAVIDTKEKITKAAFDEIFRGRSVRAGTLIMSFKLTIGRVATLGIDACHNEAIISIYPKHGVDQRYLGYFLAQVDYDALEDRQVKGNTLNQDKIDRIEIWLPPLGEQSSIADALDLLRRSIELQAQTLAVTEELKRVAMQTLFTRGLRDEAQKETEIGLVPEELGNCASRFARTNGNGTTPNRTNMEYWSGGTVPWITSGRMYERSIAGSDCCVTPRRLRDYSLPLLQPGLCSSLLLAREKRSDIARYWASSHCQPTCWIRATGSIDHQFRISPRIP